jgi:hypothetical protein
MRLMWDQALKSVREGLLFNVQKGIVTKGEKATATSAVSPSCSHLS